MKVLVTGATGRTGSLVVKQLQTQADDFDVYGFARSQAKIEQLYGTSDCFFVGDIRKKADLEPAMQGCQALVILTSAVPLMKGTPQPSSPPNLEFAPGEMPEAIDYQGQVNQIEVAKAAGVN
ncbi:MAG: hypothetical protein RLZZ435_398 [Cyanobacteriota bacterium]